MRHPWTIAILLLLLVVGLPGGEAATPLMLVNRPCRLRLRGVDLATVLSAAFWITDDDGATWTCAHRSVNDGPDWQADYRFAPGKDGRYGIRITGTYQDGHHDAEPQPGQAPEPGNMITVDRTAPMIVDSTHRFGQDLAVTLTWRVEDAHPSALPVSLQWQDRDGAWWVYGQDHLPASGSTTTKPITEDVMALRLVATDLAGNQSVGDPMVLVVRAVATGELPPVEGDPLVTKTPVLDAAPPSPPPSRDRQILAEMEPSSRFEAAVISETIVTRFLGDERPTVEGPAQLLWDAHRALADGRNADARDLYRQLRGQALAAIASAEEMDLLRLAGRHEEALALRWAVPPEADQAPIHLAHARVLMALDRLPDAETVLAAIPTADPNSSEAQYLLAWCLLKRGEAMAGIQLLTYIATFNDVWGQLAVGHLLNHPG